MWTAFLGSNKFLFWSISNIDTTIPHNWSFLASLAISVKYYLSQLKPLFNTIPIMFFIDFLILSHPIEPHATTSIEYAKP